ncbi:unnamed protein product [Chrysoparadoxa australica]
MLMILAPNRSFTKIIMESWGPIIALGLVHLFIVVVSISLPSGTAPIAEFADVFDPAKDNLGAMLGMMRYPNFVSEEWSHVSSSESFPSLLPHPVHLYSPLTPTGAALGLANWTVYMAGWDSTRSLHTTLCAPHQPDWSTWAAPSLPDLHCMREGTASTSRG